MASFCPSYLPLAIIEWTDHRGGESDSPLIPVGFDNWEYEETSTVQFTITKALHPTQTDFWGNAVYAYFLTIVLDGNNWEASDSFPTLHAAKEFATYVLWQLRKGNRLASVPCFLD